MVGFTRGDKGRVMGLCDGVCGEINDGVCVRIAGLPKDLGLV